MAVEGEADFTLFTHSPRRRLKRSRDQLRQTMRPVKESRRMVSEEVREVAIRSVMEKSGAEFELVDEEAVGVVEEVVERRRRSRRCEPEGLSARMSTGC